MKKQNAWALKNKTNGFVKSPLTKHFWEADRTLLFRTKKQAEAWLASNTFWNPKAEVVRVVITIREYGE